MKNDSVINIPNLVQHTSVLHVHATWLHNTLPCVLDTYYTYKYLVMTTNIEIKLHLVEDLTPCSNRPSFLCRSLEGYIFSV